MSFLFLFISFLFLFYFFFISFLFLFISFYFILKSRDFVDMQTSSKHMFDYQHRLQHRQRPQTATQEDTTTSTTPLLSRLTATRPPWPPIPRAQTTTKSWSRKCAQKGEGRTGGRKGRGMGTGLEMRLVSSPWCVFFTFFWTTTDRSFFLQLGLPDNNYYHHLWRPQRRYRAQTTAYHVVWALTEYFFFIHRILYTY